MFYAQDNINDMDLDTDPDTDLDTDLDLDNAQVKKFYDLALDIHKEFSTNKYGMYKDLSEDSLNSYRKEFVVLESIILEIEKRANAQQSKNKLLEKLAKGVGQKPNVTKEMRQNLDDQKKALKLQSETVADKIESQTHRFEELERLVNDFYKEGLDTFNENSKIQQKYTNGLRINVVEQGLLEVPDTHPRKIQISEEMEKIKSVLSKHRQRIDYQHGILENEVRPMLESIRKKLQTAKQALAKVRSTMDDVVAATRETKKNNRVINVVKHTDRPLSRIFEQKPVNTNLKSMLTYSEVQNFIYKNYKSAFEFPRDQSTDWTCDKPGIQGAPNNAQRFCYHHMNPNNTDVDLLLAHSAGSGKTATMMLIMSLFMRKGYMPIIVSKKSLFKGYLTSCFSEGADFNVQQYLAANGVSTVRHLVAKERDIRYEQVTFDEVIERGELIWKEMGLPPFTENSIITYVQLTNMAKGKGSTYTTCMKWGDSDAHKDCCWKKIFLLDEAHKLSAISTDMKSHEIIDPVAVIKMLWHSRAVSGKNCVRVVAATATPVADGVVDGVIIANLLVNKENGIDMWSGDRATYDAEYTQNESGKKSVVAKSAWMKQKAAFTNVFMKHKDSYFRKLESSLRGRVSFLNLVGDRGHFAQRQVTVVNVDLSPRQQDIIAQFTLKFAGLELNSYTGEWLVAESENIPKNAKNAPIRFRSSMARNIMFPASSQRIFTHLKGVFNKTSTIPRKSLRTHSPMIEKILMGIQKEMDRPKPQKQFIFNDLAKGALDNAYGVNLIAAMLRDHLGFVSITEKIDDPIDLISAAALNNIPSYRGMLVLNLKNKEIAEKLLKEHYNTNENHDGSKVFVVLMDGNYKEGMNLYDVGGVHIAGYVDSRADFVQSAARAFRNCKSINLPFGEPVRVTMYKPRFAGTYSRSKKTPRQLIKSVMKDKTETVMAKMNDLFKKVAVDSYLLKNITEVSEKQEGEMSLAD